MSATDAASEWVAARHPMLAGQRLPDQSACGPTRSAMIPVSCRSKDLQSPGACCRLTRWPSHSMARAHTGCYPPGTQPSTGPQPPDSTRKAPHRRSDVRTSSPCRLVPALPLPPATHTSTTPPPSCLLPPATHTTTTTVTAAAAGSLAAQPDASAPAPARKRQRSILDFATAAKPQPRSGDGGAVAAPAAAGGGHVALAGPAAPGQARRAPLLPAPRFHLMVQRPEEGLLAGLWEFPGGAVNPRRHVVHSTAQSVPRECMPEGTVGCPAWGSQHLWLAPRASGPDPGSRHREWVPCQGVCLLRDGAGWAGMPH